MTNAQRLGLASEHLLERSKSTPHSAELKSLVLHQEVLESLVSGSASAPKAPKSAKSAKKKSPASATSPVTPAPDTAAK